MDKCFIFAIFIIFSFKYFIPGGRIFTYRISDSLAVIKRDNFDCGKLPGNPQSNHMETRQQESIALAAHSIYS